MSPLITLLILGAAFIHACWNALLRSTSDRLRGMLVINLVCPLVSIPLVLWQPMPLPAAWPYLFISGFLVVGYNIFLVSSYKYGELGQVYPIARGAAPLLVTLGAMLLANEQPSPHMLIGIALISCGIVSLAQFKHHLHRHTFFSALATGCFIASYTVVDGLGGRLSQSPIAYTGWRSLICTIIMCVIYWRQYRHFGFNPRDRETQKAAGAAVIAMFGYCIIIWAMMHNPMGAVSALRETSVVFATLIGVVFLKEKFSKRRMVACVVIAIGAALLQ